MGTPPTCSYIPWLAAVLLEDSGSNAVIAGIRYTRNVNICLSRLGGIGKEGKITGVYNSSDQVLSD